MPSAQLLGSPSDSGGASRGDDDDAGPLALGGVAADTASAGRDRGSDVEADAVGATGAGALQLIVAMRNEGAMSRLMGVSSPSRSRD